MVVGCQSHAEAQRTRRVYLCQTRMSVVVCWGYGIILWQPVKTSKNQDARSAKGWCARRKVWSIKCEGWRDTRGAKGREEWRVKMWGGRGVRHLAAAREARQGRPLLFHVVFKPQEDLGLLWCVIDLRLCSGQRLFLFLLKAWRIKFLMFRALNLTKMCNFVIGETINIWKWLITFRPF